MPHVTLSAYPMIHYSQEMRPVFFLWCDQQDNGLRVWGCHTIKYISWTRREKVSWFIEFVLRLKRKALKLLIKLLNKSPYVYFLKKWRSQRTDWLQKIPIVDADGRYLLTLLHKLASFLCRVHFKASWYEGCSKGQSSEIFCFWTILKQHCMHCIPKCIVTSCEFFSYNIVDKVGGYKKLTVLI